MLKKAKLIPGERPNEYQVYNLGEASSWLRIDPRILKVEIEKGKLPAIKAGEQTYRISGENLLRYTGSATVAQMQPNYTTPPNLGVATTPQSMPKHINTSGVPTVDEVLERNKTRLRNEE